MRRIFAWALVLAVLAPYGVRAQVQVLVPTTTINSVYGLPTLPLNSGTDCIYVVQPASTPPDRSLCSDYAAAMGGIQAPANTILMNPYGGPSVDAPLLVPSCADSLGAQLNYITNTGLACSPGLLLNAITFSNFAIPSGTNSSSYVMVGLAANAGFASTITPLITGNIYVSFAGGQINGSVNPQQVSYQIRYGTGTPPVNGTPIFGTQLGSIRTIVVPEINNRSTIRAVGYVTGLTLGTQYWFDLAIAAPGGGFAQVYALNGFLAER